jgi:hypothetical protein
MTSEEVGGIDRRLTTLCQCIHSKKKSLMQDLSRTIDSRSTGQEIPHFYESYNAVFIKSYC